MERGSIGRAVATGNGHNRDLIRILIMEDRLLVAESLQVSLSVQPDLEIIGIAHSRTEALKLAAAHAPDVALIGSCFLFDGGPPLVSDQRAAVRVAIVVIASNGHHHESLLNWIDSGCHGFVHISSSLSEMVSVIRRAAAGEVAIPASVLYEAVRHERRTAAQRQANSKTLGQLTPRERQVLDLIGHGLDNRTIAKHLGVSIATARGHVQSVLEKLGVHSKLQAMRYVTQPPPDGLNRDASAVSNC
jgi:DNA-binding NarL/FixJ family response regulator